MKILHCITDLSPDGAQRTLLRLLSKLQRSRFDCRVLSLMEGGHFLDQFRNLGIEVAQIGMKRGIPGPAALMALRAAVHHWKPDVIQGWMYHGNLAALVAATLAGSSAPVLWNIRRCLYEAREDKGLTRWVIKLGARTSHRADRIIYCVKVAADQHESIGFDATKRKVIANGFDIKRFCPTTEHRAVLRGELGLESDTTLIGTVGRYHRQKDFPTFLRAAARVLKTRPEVHFIMAGRDVTTSTQESSILSRDLGIAHRVHLLGERQDVPAILASLDLFVSSSRNEGFSNVVGEAMSCGIPCVATNAGASAELLEGICPVVQREDPSALSSAIEQMLALPELERKRRGLQCRKRIESQYSLDSMVESYASLYAQYDSLQEFTQSKAA